MRIKKLLVVGTSLAAMAAVTGASVASAGTKGATKPAEVVSTTDTDSIQSGDQTSPDSPSTGAKAASFHLTANKQSTAATPGENPGESSETSGESSETGVSDGPGGHEDAAGQNVDYQFDGEQ